LVLELAEYIVERPSHAKSSANHDVKPLVRRKID